MSSEWKFEFQIINISAVWIMNIIKSCIERWWSYAYPVCEKTPNCLTNEPHLHAVEINFHSRYYKLWKEVENCKYLRIRNTLCSVQVSDINSWMPYWKFHDEWMKMKETEIKRERERGTRNVGDFILPATHHQRHLQKFARQKRWNF